MHCEIKSLNIFKESFIIFGPMQKLKPCLGKNQHIGVENTMCVEKGDIYSMRFMYVIHIQIPLKWLREVTT